MKIALYHGYELTGSGSNEYTRYLAATLARQGHAVIVLCREPTPERIPFVARAVAHDATRGSTTLFDRPVEGPGICVHVLPVPPVLPVYVTDKERPGSVRAFVDLSNAELETYHALMCSGVQAALESERPDVLHANHCVWQPAVAAEVCPPLGIPFYVVPHGSAIEYTVKLDDRFRKAAERALAAASGLVFISREVKDRVTRLFGRECERLGDRSALIGIGTDTSLFQPIPPNPPRERDESRAQLVAEHRPGGRPLTCRTSLAQRVRDNELGDLASLRSGWNHQVEDADFVARLDAIPSHGELVAFVGSLTWGKGIQALIAAMPRLLRLRPDAHLLIVGSGRFREALEALVVALDEGLEPAVRTLIERGRSLEQPDLDGRLDDVAAYFETEEGRAEVAEVKGKLASRVHFVGRLDHRRLANLLPCARVAAFPSIVKEASPLVFAEALAAGVIPAAADHSGFHDGLEDLEAELPGSLWEPMHLPTNPAHRIVGIADRLARLLELTADPSLPDRLAEIARRNYDWHGVAEQLATYAQTVIGASPQPAPS